LLQWPDLVRSETRTHDPSRVIHDQLKAAIFRLCSDRIIHARNAFAQKCDAFAQSPLLHAQFEEIRPSMTQGSQIKANLYLALFRLPPSTTLSVTAILRHQIPGFREWKNGFVLVH